MDREERIMNRLQEHYDYIKDECRSNGTPYEVVALFLQGSQNYGLDVYTDNYMSDVDSKAIVLPTFNDFILSKEPVSKTIILENKEHIDVKDIRVMFTMFKKANISYLELLFTDYKIINPKYQSIIDELMKIRDDIIDYPRLLKACYGMTLEKRKALCHPYPTIKDKIDKWGFDPKQLHHIIRLHLMLATLYETKHLTKDNFVFDEELREGLLDIKTNNAGISLNNAIASADGFCDMTKQLVDKMLQWDWKEPQPAKLDELLIRTLRQYFKEDILNEQ